MRADRQRRGARLGRRSINPAGDTAVFTVFPLTTPQDGATRELVHHLRDDDPPAARLAGTTARPAT